MMTHPRESVLWRTGAAGALAFAASVLVGLHAIDTAARSGTQSTDKKEVTEEWNWSGAVTAGSTVTVNGVNGSMHAVSTTGTEIIAHAIKSGRRSNPHEVKIEVRRHGSDVTICAIYPGSGNGCDLDGEYHPRVHNNDVHVDFELQIPTGVHFSGHTVNGGVTAEKLRGNIDAHTVNGTVTLSTSGYAAARTVNGSIRAAFSGTRWDDPLEFKTVNGSITLDLPQRLDADVHAQAVNGGISTDFPAVARSRPARKTLDTTLGFGGPELRCQTVNGSITLRTSI
jgi:hypothetical protein